ncbi:hypothetical protein H9L39_02917 [Fusarium oxysporum f. sp. albedinis]|jgi:hypothetical protein|nr:hypothetical protein H9L39_02917 [Fusarium oxysporum f. sp. albedinis]
MSIIGGVESIFSGFGVSGSSSGGSRTSERPERNEEKRERSRELGLFWGIDGRGVIGESGEEPKKTELGLRWRVGEMDSKQQSTGTYRFVRSVGRVWRMEGPFR